MKGQVPRKYNLLNRTIQQMYLNIESDVFHDVHPLGECFGYLLHTVKILHRLLDISVLLQQLKLT